MTQIVISALVWDHLSELAKNEIEHGAALFLSRDEFGDRYLVQEIRVAKGADCVAASATEFSFSPAFISAITRRAREERLHVALFHTHPQGFFQFSRVDDETEAGLAGYFRARVPDQAPFSLVMCGRSIRARFLGTNHYIDVRRVGAEVENTAGRQQNQASEGKYDRQVRAFGEQGQAVLGRLRVAIIGLGGTGSLVALQLAHLGVQRFALIDADRVELTNINRVVGTTPESMGKLKVATATDMIEAILPNAEVEQLANSVMTEKARRIVCGSDCVFLCTDSHSSRAFVNELAYQYLIPVFDMGVSISAAGGRVDAVTGRIQMLAPGLPCLLCSQSIDYEAVRQELMSPKERAADPYFNGAVDVKQPAVISINSTAASLAVTMFLGAFTGIPARARWQSYNALSGTVRVFSTESQSDCGVCGQNGITAAGDGRALGLLQAETE